MNIIDRFALLSALLISTSAQSANIDCAKARKPIERMICSDQTVMELDSTLAEIYGLELEKPDNAARVKASQKKWLTLRDKCPETSCLSNEYEKRLAELTCSSDSLMAGSAIGAGQCAHYSLKGLERELTALDQRYAKQLVAESNNPEHLAKTLKTEQTVWRSYRTAKCALYGQLEGGIDGWKNAFAGMCEVTETAQRIKDVKADLGDK